MYREEERDHQLNRGQRRKRRATTCRLNGLQSASRRLEVHHETHTSSIYDLKGIRRNEKADAGCCSATEVGKVPLVPRCSLIASFDEKVRYCVHHDGTIKGWETVRRQTIGCSQRVKQCIALSMARQFLIADQTCATSSKCDFRGISPLKILNSARRTVVQANFGVANSLRESEPGALSCGGVGGEMFFTDRYPSGQG